MELSDRTLLLASRVPLMPLPSSACWACWWLIDAFMAPAMEELGILWSFLRRVAMPGGPRSCTSGGYGKGAVRDQAYLAFLALQQHTSSRCPWDERF